MRALLFSAFILGSMYCVTSCAKQPELEPKVEKKEDQLVGRISTLYPEQKYMLIQKYSRFSLDSDAIFYTRSANGRTHPIKMTSQQLGQFYVADTLDGEYAINDPVYLRKLSNSSHKNPEVDATQQASATLVLDE